ncbi:MAG TPA: prolyl oligopeptidase family serine peptidase [Vicinamibacterales bacterium]|nr:prolyl oligopeptidase family serine peptidase [Vicinamibacterales bacterium]
MVSHPDSSRARTLLLTLAVLVSAALAWPTAQAPTPAPQATAASAPVTGKRALTVDDYTKWRSISGQEISGDGKWVAYTLQLTNVPTTDTKPVLHLLNLETNKDTEIPNGTGGAFSSDSKWIAYQIDPGGAGRGGRGGRGAGAGAGGGATPAGGDQDAPAGRSGTTPPPNPRRVELRNLASGAVRSWQDIQTFTFSANASHLLLRRRPANAAGRGAAGDGAATAPGGAPGGGAAAAGGAAEAPAGPRGVDVTVHNLTTGRDQLLGSVGDISFNKTGELVAYTVDAAVKDSNGLFVLDLRSNRINALDNDAKVYNRLTWNEEGTALAVLKGTDVEKMRERSNVMLIYPNIQAALGDGGEPPPVIFDPVKTDTFPKGWVLSDRAALDWSDDNKRVFFGMKEQVAVPTTPARRNADEVADVDVWNTNDERIQSVQMIRAEADRNFTFREVFDVSAGKFVKLADETMRDVDIAPDGRWAVGRDTRGYVSDYKRPAADIYRINTTTGERTLMLKNQLIGAHVFGISPDGKQYLFWKDSKFQAYNLDAAAIKALGGATAPNFTDMEFDHPGPRPSYGIAGYTSDGATVIVQQRYDLWALPIDGSAARSLTNGQGLKGETRFRYVRTEPADAAGGGAPGGGPGGGGRGGGAARQTIDLSKPITLSAYGEYTKKAGFYELANGTLREVVYEDAAFSNPTRAAKAEKFLFTRQTFVEFPDLRVSGPDFKNSTKISDANPQQAEFKWGKRILFDFKNKDGMRLQGILALPDDYKAGEKRPMIVNFYEDNSQNLHRYSAPSYLTGMGSSPIQAVSEGYITMLPDIHFRTGSSHSDMLECVEAAVKKVIEMGYVDPKRIGINGHSYGGEGAAFIGTRSRLFAAVGMGAGVTDLYSDFNQSWGWSYQVSGGSGANGHDYYLYGQGRWGFTPWDQPEVYRFESAITHVKEVTQPFLIMHGTADPTVSFSEGMNFYNALRYAGKSAVMLAYPGEGHGLRGLANRKDLTIRYFQFFNHYLKGDPAPKWLSEGVAYLKKDAAKDPK